jgi:hypothetical protein
VSRIVNASFSIVLRDARRIVSKMVPGF